MTHVEREFRQIYLDVLAVLVPSQECSHSEAVPEILNSWTTPVLVANTDRLEQLCDRLTEADAGISTSSGVADQRRFRPAVEAGALARVEVAPQFGAHA